MSMLNSSVFSYQDGLSQENALNFATSYLLQQQQQQQQQSSSGIGASGFGSNILQSQSINSSSATATQASHQRIISGNVANTKHDTPSPEVFQLPDFAGSPRSYLYGESMVPQVVHQAVGEASRLFKFQAQQGLSNNDDSQLFNNGGQQFP
ncbi:hypothetical protein BGZ79_003849 [Entomortierella chlamydospora]|nr:hypothetical protein BGZ79_003849 [Entomortierella chlamydospora]